MYDIQSFARHEIRRAQGAFSNLARLAFAIGVVVSLSVLLYVLVALSLQQIINDAPRTAIIAWFLVAPFAVITITALHLRDYHFPDLKTYLAVIRGKAVGISHISRSVRAIIVGFGIILAGTILLALSKQAYEVVVKGIWSLDLKSLGIIGLGILQIGIARAVLALVQLSGRVTRKDRTLHLEGFSIQREMSAGGYYVQVLHVHALGDRVVVRPSQREEVTKSGIVIPDTAKEKPQEGTIIAVGKGKVSDKGDRVALEVKEGDRVLFAKYGGTEFKLDGEDLLVLRESDILAIIEGKED